MRTGLWRSLRVGVVSSFSCAFLAVGGVEAQRCRVSEIEVATVSVQVGAREPLLVFFRDAQGIPCQADPQFTATSNNPNVARVVGGFVVGVAVGQAVIAVRTGRGPQARTGVGAVVVHLHRPIGAIILVVGGSAQASNQSNIIPIGGTVRLSARALAADDGAEVPEARITWRVIDPEGAFVVDTVRGIARAVRAGQATIVVSTPVSSDSIATASARIRVGLPH